MPKVSTKIRRDEQSLDVGRVARRSFYVSVGLFGLFLLSFLFLPSVISSANAAQDVTVGAGWVATTLTLDPDVDDTAKDSATHGDVNFGEVTPTTATAEGNLGTERVVKKTIGVTTNGQYYTVYLSTVDSSTALKYSGTDSNIKINPVSGTWTDPSAFSGSSWGFAVPGTTISESVDDGEGGTTAKTPTFEQDTRFVDSTTLGKDLTKTSNSGIYNKDVWAAVPASSTPQQIWKATTTNNYGFGGDSGDSEKNHFDIYYGVMVGSDVLAGTYSNKILYTALASAKSLDEVSTNLLVSERFVTSGTTETLKFDVAMSVANENILSAEDVEVYVVPHADAVAGVSTLNTNKSGYKKCSGSGTDGALTASDITFASTGSTINCSMPTESIVWDGSTGTATDGYFDIWITIPSYSANYISMSTEAGTGTRVASVVYAGLQSITNSTYQTGDTKNYLISEMQEMTANVCKNTNIWGKTYGDDARVYASTDTSFSSALSTSAAGSAAIGVGTFALGDNRETVTYTSGTEGYKRYGASGYKLYLVRRLADGNCWMVQNLDLNLANFAGTEKLTSENTNLVSKTTWDPSKALRTRTWATDSSKTGGYDNTLGTAGILEPGVIASVGNNLSVATYQFQSRLNFGPNLFWGSRYKAGTTEASAASKNNPSATDADAIAVENNANAEYARSYDNGLGYLTGTANTKDPDACAAIAGNEAKWEAVCHENGQIGNQGGSKSSVTQSTDGTTQDTVWQPELITSSDGATFTMRGSKYYGDYYNWYAATAESGKFNMSTASSYTASDSICPKGWKLPVNGGSDTNGSWQHLINGVYGYVVSNGYNQNNRAALNKIKQLPLSVPFAGYYEWTNGALNNRGVSGGYWSGTATTTSAYAYDLYMNYGGYVYSQDTSNKVFGFTVRCIAE